MHSGCSIVVVLFCFPSSVVWEAYFCCEPKLPETLNIFKNPTSLISSKMNTPHSFICEDLGNRGSIKGKYYRSFEEFSAPRKGPLMKTGWEKLHSQPGVPRPGKGLIAKAICFTRWGSLSRKKWWGKRTFIRRKRTDEVEIQTNGCQMVGFSRVPICYVHLYKTLGSPEHAFRHCFLFSLFFVILKLFSSETISCVSGS